MKVLAVSLAAGAHEIASWSQLMPWIPTLSANDGSTKKAKR